MAKQDAGDEGLAASRGKTGRGEVIRSSDSPSDDDHDEKRLSDDSVASSESVYDSEVQDYDDDDDDNGNDDEDDSEEDDFEDQGSSDDDEELLDRQQNDDDDDSDDGIIVSYENVPRTWKSSSSSSSAISGKRKTHRILPEEGEREDVDGDDDDEKKKASSASAALRMHTDNWSSDDDDEEGTGNRIGRVPLHWYDEYDHIGYDAHGRKVIKSASAADGGGGGGDRIDRVLAEQDNRAVGKFVVRDALNDRDVELSARQVELIRRVQSGAYAHPEHDAEPDYIDYYSGVNREISGLGSNRYEPKARFLPSRWERMQVDKLLDKLHRGKINMDYLTGKIRDMKDANKKDDDDRPFLLWKGDEEDLLSTRKGPQHIPAPKLPPPGHAHSYRPPDEYLPTEEEMEKWKDMEPADRPHGHMVPKKFPNLRSVGSYRHSVREAFERCLDLYLCPRVMKRRLNIDPESLVPKLPSAGDLKPFPAVKCIEYVTPREEGQEEPPFIRCVAASPDGQFMASGASDGYVRLWEVQTGRLLRSWDLSEATKAATTEDEHGNDDGGTGEEKHNDGDEKDNKSKTPKTKKPVVALEWNPNRAHHCLLAAAGNAVVIIATGTAGKNDAEVTDALLSCASRGGSSAISSSSSRASKAVRWIALPSSSSSSSSGGSSGGKKNQSPISAHATGLLLGPVCALRTNREVASVRWQSKGDYFVSVSPKAGAASVLIHQLSRGHSQQPFRKSKGEVQLACFHPNKPFLFVASQQHVRVYHLVKQNMVKRLASGCRWIASMDVHPTGDHVILGSLDRRMVWFDLDLGASPFKTLKYHERALRCVRYHHRYPLMASASDDGTVHVFHCTVYDDLMRNPLVVPVKILRGHAVTEKKFGVLALAFHPKQPWLFTAGADGRIFLFQDI